YSGDGGKASEAAISMPNSLSLPPGGSGPLVIAEFGNSVVREVSPACL
ncbi:unnamed protein product, partial [Choristocarpus tenellus]